MKSIWIVDDDHSIRFVLERALAREQLPVRSFASASEVIGALDGDEPQVLVSDIRMPGGSGIDLLAKLKLRLPGLPVIVMTAYSDLDSAVGAFQAGAFEYLPKPFDLPKAVELIRRALEESLREPSRDVASAPLPEGKIACASTVTLGPGGTTNAATAIRSHHSLVSKAPDQPRRPVDQGRRVGSTPLPVTIASRTS
mgnify:CR=1 FL=1